MGDIIMAQIIVYMDSQENFVVNPAPINSNSDYLIDELNNCPSGAFIMDSSELPQGISINFSNSWTIKNNKVIVDLDKAKNEQLDRLKDFDNQFIQLKPNLINNTNYQDALVTMQNQILSSNTIEDIFSSLNLFNQF